MKKVFHKRRRKSWYKLTRAEMDRELAAVSIEERAVYPPSRRNNFIHWSSAKGPSYRKTITMLTVPNFIARGMRCFYGREDLFTKKFTFGMEMLLRKDGRLFIRFYSPGKRVTYRSYELLGLKLPPLPERGKLSEDDFVPEILRDLYEEWVIECCNYPDMID